MGVEYGQKGDFAKALEYFQKAKTKFLNSFGNNHSYSALSNFFIGEMYNCLGDYSTALEYFYKSLKRDLFISKKESVDVAIDYEDIGHAYLMLGKFNQALEYIEKTLRIRVRHLSEQHPRTGVTYLSLASTFYALGYLNAGLDKFQKGFEILCASTERDFSVTFRSLRRILVNLKHHGRSKDTELVTETIYPYFVQLLGQENTLTVQLLNFKEELHAIGDINQ